MGKVTAATSLCRRLLLYKQKTNDSFKFCFKTAV